jgi:hypothetical protein
VLIYRARERLSETKALIGGDQFPCELKIAGDAMGFSASEKRKIPVENNSWRWEFHRERPFFFTAFRRWLS